MKKILNILLYLPMLPIGIYYSMLFSVPDSSDTIPAASMFIGILLVAVPMLIFSVFDIIAFIIGLKSQNRKVINISLICGIVIPFLAFLWLFIISGFTVYTVTGIYAVAALIIGVILLISDTKNKNI